MNRRCSPSPIRPSSSEALTLNFSFRPSTPISSAVAETVCPMPVGLMCEAAICPPTVVQSSSRLSATQSMAAFSISANIIGVARTLRSPLPTAHAKWHSSTTNVLVYFLPVSIFLGFSVSDVHRHASLILLRGSLHANLRCESCRLHDANCRC